ncbi:MAG: transposase [Planctomycetes bacterium]|nr:transposase [Planctomycetota bacterium]
MAEGIRKRLKRWEDPSDWRYLTCSTYRRFQFFDDAVHCDVFAIKLEEARKKLGFELRAWVLMLEHFHVILHPIGGVTVPQILKRVKQSISKVLHRRWETSRMDLVKRVHFGEEFRLWQPGGGFDRNIRDGVEMDREIAYIHNNPVKGDLVKTPTDWAWSSSRHYAGDPRSPVQIVYRKWTPYRDDFDQSQTRDGAPSKL